MPWRGFLAEWGFGDGAETGEFPGLGAALLGAAGQAGCAEGGGGGGSQGGVAGETPERCFVAGEEGGGAGGHAASAIRLA